MARSGRAEMWDAGSAAAGARGARPGDDARRAGVGVHLAGERLALTPDPALLGDPNASTLW
jgi:hypothetical protein